MAAIAVVYGQAHTDDGGDVVLGPFKTMADVPQGDDGRVWQGDDGGGGDLDGGDGDDAWRFILDK